MIDMLLLQALLQGLLIFLRVASFITFFPVFTSRVPRLVKLGFVFGLTMLWYGRPGLMMPTVVLVLGKHGGLILVVLLIREAVFGAGLGFAFGLLTQPARVAGAYIGQEMGLSLASIADPSTGAPSGILGQLLEWLAVMLLFSLNVHHTLFYALNLSFETLGIGQRAFLYTAQDMFRHADLADRLSLLIIAPVGIVMFLTVVGLGLLMRAVPQVNIFSVGLALRAAVGMVALLFFLPAVLTVLARVLHEVPYVLENSTL